MNLFYEESGNFKASKILFRQGEAYFVENSLKEKIKVRSRDVLLEFNSSSSENFISEAKKLAEKIDITILWKIAGSEEISYLDLAKKYYKFEVNEMKSASIFILVFSNPIYFIKKGKGRFIAVNSLKLKLALKGVEKKKKEIIYQNKIIKSIKNGLLPNALKKIKHNLLFKPNKNTVEYKAFNKACKELNLSSSKLMFSLGELPSAKDFHVSRFLFENFSEKTEVSNFKINKIPNIKKSAVNAFSIDDISTTEIDDAFSVTFIDKNIVKVGIHIAAPALGFDYGEIIDKLASERVCTVYFPGEKITMLPKEVIEKFSLLEGSFYPTLSIYITLNSLNLEEIEKTTVLDYVYINSNLRLQDIEKILTFKNLENNSWEHPFKKEITIIWSWAKKLESIRKNNRKIKDSGEKKKNILEYNFFLVENKININKRKRGQPIDKIVSELMIYANSFWGKLLHEKKIPGIFRTQNFKNKADSHPQTRMLTKAEPHLTLGIDCYAWCTSPLRRYSDLVNQRQILSYLNNEPLNLKNSQSQISVDDLNFYIQIYENTYSNYINFQKTMERYWCLKWLQQNSIKIVKAEIIRENYLKLIDIPLTINLSNFKLSKGTIVNLEILDIDEFELSVNIKFINISNEQLKESFESQIEEIYENEKLF